MPRQLPHAWADVATLRQRLWQTTARVLARARTDRVMEAVMTVQQGRVWVEDVQDGVLHMAALPTRQDVRRLQRKVDSLRRRVTQLDLLVAELEAQADKNRTGSK